MTLTLDRPVTGEQTLPAVPSSRCPQGLRWCVGDPNTHDRGILPEGESVYHDSTPVNLPLSGGSNNRGSNGLTVSLERQDAIDGTPGHVRVYLATTRNRVPVGQGGGYATLDEAERIAAEIHAHVFTARGMKRAGDLRIGDRIAVDRVTHTVAGVKLHTSSGALHVYTDLSGECVAAQYKPGEMVPLRGHRSRISTHLGAAALAALGRLSVRQRTAMQLRYVNGMSTGEAARVMGVRPDKVKTYLGRAKTQLREWGVLDTVPALGGAA